MSRRRLGMRQIKEVLRLKHTMNLSQQAISNSTGIPRSTVRDYLIRAQGAGLSFPLPDGMENEQLNALLFPVKESGTVGVTFFL